MRQLLDFLPLLVFFAFYSLYDIFVATQALIIATALTLLFLWYQFRKAGKQGLNAFIRAEKIPVFTFMMVLIFGSLTIYFRANSFIIWKVTFIYGLFAAALLISQFIFNKPLIQRLLGKELSLPQPVWSKINLFWGLFFIGCGALNLYVGFNLPEATWITFKTFIFPAIMFACTLLTGLYIYRFLPKDNGGCNNKAESVQPPEDKD